MMTLLRKYWTENQESVREVFIVLLFVEWLSMAGMTFDTKNLISYVVIAFVCGGILIPMSIIHYKITGRSILEKDETETTTE